MSSHEAHPVGGGSPNGINRTDRTHGTYLPSLILAAVMLLALLAWVSVAVWGDTRRTWGILLADFLFLSSLAAGLMVWPAIVVVSRGRWMGSMQRTALAGAVLLPVCVLLLLVLAAGAGAWAPWLDHETRSHFWLRPSFLFTRDVVALVLFSGLAFWFVAAMRGAERPRRLAAWLIFVYALVFSLLGFDLGMALDPHWYSALFGVYFFISGLYIAAAAWAVLTVLADPEVTPHQLNDQAKLIMTFSLLTTYMMYSQLFPIWYENLPHEIRFLVPRMNPAVADWPTVSAILLATIYLGPLVLFLPGRARRTGAYVGVVATLVLAGMWVERWWLVMPSLGQPLGFGLSEITGLLALLAGTVFFVLWVRHRLHENPAPSA